MELHVSNNNWVPFPTYPKRASVVFQQTYGTLDALMKVETTIFALYAGNMIARYTILPRSEDQEPIVSLKWAGKRMKDFLTTKSVTVDKKIKSAFALPGQKTVLVAEDLQSYYEVRLNLKMLNSF
jgi:hypothetical protein